MTDDERDAARWRALMACERIRVIGSARIGTDDPHINLELWGKYPDVAYHSSHQQLFQRYRNRQTLTDFVDGMLPKLELS